MSGDRVYDATFELDGRELRVLLIAAEGMIDILTARAEAARARAADLRADRGPGYHPSADIRLYAQCTRSAGDLAPIVARMRRAMLAAGQDPT